MRTSCPGRRGDYFVLPFSDIACSGGFTASAAGHDPNFNVPFTAAANGSILATLNEAANVSGACHIAHGAIAGIWALLRDEDCDDQGCGGISVQREPMAPAMGLLMERGKTPWRTKN